MADKQHILTGTTAPASAPPGLGAHYINTATGDHYLASGTASADDWGLPVYTGEPPTPEPGGGNGIVYATDAYLDPGADGVTFSIPANRRVVEIEMPNSDDVGSNQAKLKLPSIPVSESDHELLLVVNRTREENAAELVLQPVSDGGSQEVYYTVVPQTLRVDAGSSSETTWTIPVPIGYSIFRIYRRYARAYFIATLAQ